MTPAASGARTNPASSRTESALWTALSCASPVARRRQEERSAAFSGGLERVAAMTRGSVVHHGQRNSILHATSPRNRAVTVPITVSIRWAPNRSRRRPRSGAQKAMTKV